MRLSGVGRRYGLRGGWVLRGVDLDLPPGTLTRVEGANGSGKSTLLRLVAGIDAPSEGRIVGRPRTAYVPERFPAALPFTAGGYLTHLARVHGVRGGEAARRAAYWLERFGAGDHLPTPMARLSKGSSQKVALAQAFVGEPALLLLDEAWTGLDEDSRREADRAVVERVAAGAAVVFVDHDRARLAGLPDTVVRLEDGRVLVEPVGPAPEDPARTGGPRTVLLLDGPGDAGALTSLVAGVPGVPAPERAAGGGHRLTVPAAASDAVLRALLTAAPPWHVRSVTPLRAGPTRPGGGPPDPVPAADRAGGSFPTTADEGGARP